MLYVLIKKVTERFARKAPIIFNFRDNFSGTQNLFLSKLTFKLEKITTPLAKTQRRIQN